MTFTVTYRDQRGAKREEAIEAADRTACVAVCRARGISPLAIREGANGRKGVKGANGDKGSKGLNGPKGVKGDSRSPRRHSTFSILHFTFSSFVLSLARPASSSTSMRFHTFRLLMP